MDNRLYKIEIKKKYVYLTYTKHKIVKVEKNKFSMGLTFKSFCSCPIPLRNTPINDICLKCGRPIDLENTNAN